MPAVATLPARFYGGSPIPAVPDGPQRGQLVIRGKYPYGPKGNPLDVHHLADDNPFFLQEIDQVYLRDRPLAAKIMIDAIGRGMNHFAVGPAYAAGYRGQYPDTDWRGNPVGFANFLAWMRAFGVRLTLMAFPDRAPYWLGQDDGWDWSAIDRDLKPLYDQPLVRAAISRVCVGWEIWTYIEKMTPGYDRLYRWFPAHPRFWHNGPGHGCPGMSNESEEKCWRVAAEHWITGMLFQGFPLSTSGLDRPPLDQLKYDLDDMRRRFIGRSDSPWGPPVATPDGKPITTEFFEMAAYDQVNNDAPDAIGTTCADAAVSVEGIVDSEDGLPGEPGSGTLVTYAPRPFRRGMFHHRLDARL